MSDTYKVDRFTDYPYSQRQDVELYRGCFDLDNETIEFETGLDEYKDSKSVLNANNINSISDTTEAMMAEWGTGVIDYLEDGLETFQSLINNLSSIRTWDNQTTSLYYKNQIVVKSVSDGAYYLCIKNCNGSIALPDSSESSNEYWVRLYIKGEPGDESWDLNYLGRFNWAENTYSPKDVVYVERNTEVDFYVCKQGVTYSGANDPQNDSTHWRLMFAIYKYKLLIEDKMPTNFDHPYNNVFAVKDSFGSTTVESEAYSLTVPDNGISAKINKIGGKSVVWNQLSKLKKVDAINDITCPYNLAPSAYFTDSGRFVIPSGHKALLISIRTANDNLRFAAAGDVPYVNVRDFTQRYATIITGTGVPSWANYKNDGTESASGTLTFIVCDLTQMFGSGNEPTSVDDPRIKAIEEYAEKHPQYNGGELMSSQTDAVGVRGRNLIPQTSANNKASVFIPKGTTVFASCKNDGFGGERVTFYRKDGTMIDYWSLVVNLENGRIGRSFSSEEDIYYVKIHSNTSSQYILTEQQLEIGNTATPYKPYSYKQIPTNLPILRSAGSVHDSVEGGKLIRRVGEVDLGTINFARYDGTSDDNKFWFAPNTAITNMAYSQDMRVVSTYPITHVSNIANVNIRLYTTDASKPSGMLYYELAEPIVTDIELPEELVNAIAVEGKGTITFEDEYKLSIPNEVTYTLQLDEDTNLVKVVDAEHSINVANPKWLDITTIMEQVELDGAPSNLKIKQLVADYNL